VRWLSAILAFIALLGLGEAFAVVPSEMLKDPALEARARSLSAELRCLVCQNQSVDDSDAPLAHDLRVLLRERITAGDTDQQVIDFLVTRYGEFILLRPRLGPYTVVLWATPIAALVVGGIVIVFALRRKRGTLANAELTGEEEDRLAGIMAPDELPPARDGRSPPSPLVAPAAGVRISGVPNLERPDSPPATAH
jgi:cytochrome c-type biogenesis protein CcmH